LQVRGETVKIEKYDIVLLKNEKTAHIVEIWEPGIAYEADIDDDGEYITDTIKQDDILVNLTI